MNSNNEFLDFYFEKAECDFAPFNLLLVDWGLNVQLSFFAAPLDFTLFYFLRSAGGRGHKYMLEKIKGGWVVGGEGGGHITQTKPGNTPTCNKTPRTADPRCCKMFVVFFLSFLSILCFMSTMKNCAGDFEKRGKTLNHSRCQ